MKAYEAQQLGFHYTGIGEAAYRRERWEAAKKRAQEIKKTYKGADYRVVEERCRSRYGSELYKHIYGNAIFQKAMYFNEQRELEYLNDYGHRLEALKLEYEEKLAELEKQQNERQAEYDFMMSLKK